ncbi:unnamed protein product [Chironomus riparius]|uniref:Invertebrate defensins family profile domain-containing protein n=1 Tax=Chironomus riparius TaxID=315576 RepID=A0A9N9S6W6_9DIPT|nr:unnamed protein product [Chironomus riparius]
MRFTIIVILVLAAIALAVGNPVDLEKNIIEDESSPVDRNPRITCDILGSDAACATHCILKGFRGGWCDSRKVCNCR